MSSASPGLLRRARTAPPRARRSRALRFWPQYVAVSPFYLIFAAFGLFPVLFSAWLAFHYWNGLTPVRPAGLQQFRFLAADPVFRHAVLNTLIIWVLSTVPMLLMSLGLAAALTTVKRFRMFYQIVLFLPSVTSIVAIAIFFKTVFNEQIGLVNGALRAVGLHGIGWTTEDVPIKILIAALMTWQWVGYNAIIYYAGMRAIPADIYEAAKIDGADAFRTFWLITVPLLRPVIIFTVVVSTITGLQSFTEPQVLFSSNASVNPNSGGPGQAGMTMVLYFYQQAFTNNNFGYGAAIAYGIFAIVAVFAFINWRVVARRES